MKIGKFSERDYIKANRRASRAEELESHSRPVRIGGIHKSKKAYDRKRDKAEMKKALPYFFIFLIGELEPNPLKGELEAVGKVSCNGGEMDIFRFYLFVY